MCQSPYVGQNSYKLRENKGENALSHIYMLSQSQHPQTPVPSITPPSHHPTSTLNPKIPPDLHSIFTTLWQEKREAQQQRRERGELPCQRKYRLLRSFTRPADLPPPLSTYPAPLRFGQRVQLLAPEAADHSRLLDGASQRCPEDQVPSPRGPQARGLLLAATVSGNEVAGGLRVIGDACPLACVTPGPEPAARDVFVLRDAGRRKCGGPRDDRQGMLVYGREFYLQVGGNGGFRA